MNCFRQMGRRKEKPNFSHPPPLIQPRDTAALMKREAVAHDVSDFMTTHSMVYKRHRK